MRRAGLRDLWARARAAAAPRSAAGRGGYVLAVGVTGAALAVRVALGVEGDHDPALVLFTLPILLSAYVGGLGPGLVSTAIAAVGTNYLVLPPVSALSLPAGLESAEWLGLIVVGVVISFLNAALRWSRATAEAAEHDFNNLLLVISGYCAAARDDIGDGSGAEDLVEVQRAAERASELTRQLLAFSRRQVLNPIALDLSEVANDLLPMLRRLIGEDVEIVLLADDRLSAVHADRSQMEQVIVNLAVNARDAMPSGGTLTIETRELTLDERYASEHLEVEVGHYVCLTVTDTGTGIDPEIAAHLFEPFYTSKEMGRGTGLGLATVHGIVTQSSGHVRVYSEPGLGAAFKVYLPTSTDAAAPTQAPAADEPAGSETVLLCEDEDPVRRLMERILTRSGYTVLSAATPHEALEFARAQPDDIDVLVSDVIMPGLSGPELAKRLREQLPSLRTLFVSGYTAETARGRGNLPAGSALLEKPFNRGALLRMLRDLLDEPRAGGDRTERRDRNES